MAKRKKKIPKLIYEHGDRWFNRSLKLLYRYCVEHQYHNSLLLKKPTKKQNDALEERINFYFDFVISLGVALICYAIQRRHAFDKKVNICSELSSIVEMLKDEVTMTNIDTIREQEGLKPRGEPIKTKRPVWTADGHA